MKKMLFMVVLVAGCSVIANAQFRVGVKVGGNLAKQYVNSSEGSLFSNNHYKTYHGGLVAEFPVAKNLYIQPQLLYTRKGSTLLSASGASDMKVKMSYVEMPVYVLYKLPIAFGKVFAGAGAGIGYGIGGKVIQDGHSSSLYGKDKNWKREDISLNFTAGLELNNGLLVSINSQKGLRDVYGPSGTSVKNRSVSVSVGYMIDWKKKS